MISIWPWLPGPETQRGMGSRPPWAEVLEARVPSLLKVNDQNFFVVTIN